MTGGRFIAETVHGYGVSHVFFMPYIGPQALMEMEKLGIRRVRTHGEKAAAYMADAYARVRRGPGLCMAQSVGAANLAAGLQDARLADSDELWLFEDADFAAIAESMGCLGITAHRPSDLSGALDRALAAEKPAVIDVKTHIEGIAPPAWTPD